MEFAQILALAFAMFALGMLAGYGVRNSPRQDATGPRRARSSHNVTPSE